VGLSVGQGVPASWRVGGLHPLEELTPGRDLLRGCETSKGETDGSIRPLG
jgi:hypothetical protein